MRERKKREKICRKQEIFYANSRSRISKEAEEAVSRLLSGAHPYHHPRSLIQILRASLTRNRFWWKKLWGSLAAYVSKWPWIKKMKNSLWTANLRSEDNSQGRRTELHCYILLLLKAYTGFKMRLKYLVCCVWLGVSVGLKTWRTLLSRLVF